MRALEKYAVRAGGGSNHRFGLDDAVLIKDNHIALAGGIRAAIERAHADAGHLVKIEVEVDTLTSSTRRSPSASMPCCSTTWARHLRRGGGVSRGRAITEASGRITPETATAIAATGVDLISVGWMTHSAPILDFGLDVGQPR